MTVRLYEKYKKEITNTLKDKFNYKNDLEIPKLEKIVINMGVGEAVKDSKKIEEIEASLHISNVSHVDPDNGKPTRVKYEFKDGVKKRMSVVSGSLLDK